MRKLWFSLLYSLSFIYKYVYFDTPLESEAEMSKTTITTTTTSTITTITTTNVLSLLYYPIQTIFFTNLNVQMGATFLLSTHY